MTKIYDISQTIRGGIPVWPGDTPFALETTWGIGPECPVNVSKLTLSTHTGTHADAPLHYTENGADSATSSLSPYIGAAILVDASSSVSSGASLTRSTLAQLLPAAVPERVLIKLFDRNTVEIWPTGFPAIESDAIELLAEKGVKLIGTDTPSLDPETSKTMDAHMAVARNNMAILEGLVLDGVTPGAYELIALPLKIEGADASPVRAVLRDI
ncbi:kynurenine formamidase [Kordiimonas sediminis]|uniref:Kynurenine formamidase n=1 Tax=Kordiimonas sediminis TaxID=1735581 RepID=A0A919E8I4_9PROT|nr:arylformamidase [Kordiimonas sediminis]GHF23612.1 kynurenine formamidase [Kordiimonas sediminis]